MLIKLIMGHQAGYPEKNISAAKRPFGRKNILLRYYFTNVSEFEN